MASPFAASAQVVDQSFSGSQQDQITAIVKQITDLQIQLLLQKIAELKDQIAEILANQNKPTPVVDTPTQVPQEQAPVSKEVKVTFGAALCSVNGTRQQLKFPIDVSNVNYTYLEIRFTGTTNAGEEIEFARGITNSPYTKVLDGLEPGKYTYHITVWDGHTRPFTERTWEDTRKIVFEGDGTHTTRTCE